MRAQLICRWCEWVQSLGPSPAADGSLLIADTGCTTCVSPSLHQVANPCSQTLPKHFATNLIGRVNSFWVSNRFHLNSKALLVWLFKMQFCYGSQHTTNVCVCLCLCLCLCVCVCVYACACVCVCDHSRKTQISSMFTVQTSR